MHPEGYHGHGVTSSYFEGWYVKVVSADRSARYAVIPGVFLAPDGTGEAFVQVLDGSTGESWYHRYDLEEFGAEAEHFDVRIGPNRFSSRGIVLDLPSLTGEIRFTFVRRTPENLFVGVVNPLSRGQAFARQQPLGRDG